jgi:PAS domain-containing protein
LPCSHCCSPAGSSGIAAGLIFSAGYQRLSDLSLCANCARFPNGWPTRRDRRCKATAFGAKPCISLEKLLRGRQGAQQKVAADLEQMLEATRNLPDGVVILDDDNRIVWLNAVAAERLLGLSPNRDIGQFVLYLLRNSRFAEWLHHRRLSRTLNIDAP